MDEYESMKQQKEAICEKQKADYIAERDRYRAGLLDILAYCDMTLGHKEVAAMAAHALNGQQSAPATLPPDWFWERLAQISAHRACCGAEHDPPNGKLHGCCVVCGIPYPCPIADSWGPLDRIARSASLRP